jgi:hypothetical protein
MLGTEGLVRQGGGVKLASCGSESNRANRDKRARENQTAGCAELTIVVPNSPDLGYLRSPAMLLESRVG